jgi:hypothetical protein
MVPVLELLCNCQEYLSVLLGHPTQGLTYFAKHPLALSPRCPILLSCGGMRFRSRSDFIVIEKLIERHFESPRKLLQRLKCRHCMSVLDARDIATQQSGTLLDVPLRKLLGLPEFSESFSDIHNHPPYVHRLGTTFIGYP